MVRIPSFTRRPGAAGTATEEQRRDDHGNVDDERAAQPATTTRAARVREQIDDRGKHRATGITSADTRQDRTDAGAGPDGTVTERPGTVADRPVVDRTGTDRTDTDRVDTNRIDADRTTGRDPARPPVVKARASMLATLGLVSGVVAGLMVLSGVLAGYGVALSVLGLLLSLGGISATSRRHVAGKSDAVLGVALSVGAMVLGGLALTGALNWLTTETDGVRDLRQWLDTQFVERLPG